jgi:hypothetical protein
LPFGKINHVNLCKSFPEMAQPILHELLLSLSKTESIKCGKYVRSVFITHRPELSALYQALIKCRYQQEPFPEKQTLFAQVWPESTTYDDVQMRGAMSDLCALVEQFLVHQHLHTDPIRTDLALLAQLRDRNLDKRYQQTERRINQLRAQTTLRNAEYHQIEVECQLEAAQYITRTARTTDLPLQQISDAIDTAYLAQKLRHACTQLSHQAVYKTQYDFGLLRHLVAEIEQGEYLKTPAVALYYYCYRFMTEQYSHPYFLKFRANLHENELLFSDSERKTLYLIAINYCIRMLNTGQQDFISEGWELYQVGLQRGYFVEHDRFSSFTFNNIAAFGIKLRKFDAVEQFIHDYQHLLEPTQRDSFVSLNQARLAYHRGQYDAALVALQTADFKDLVNNLIAKTLLIKIYYQMHEWSILDAHLESFRLFISRRKLSDYHALNYGNVITLVKKLIALPETDTRARERLRKQVLETEILSEREWLLEQV